MKSKLIFAMALLLAGSAAAKDKPQPTYTQGTVQVEEIYNGGWTDTTYCTGGNFSAIHCSGGISEDTTKHYFLLLPDKITMAPLAHKGAFHSDSAADTCSFSCKIFYRIGNHDVNGADIFIFIKNGKESKYYLKFDSEQTARVITNLAKTLQQADDDRAAGK